VAKFLVRDGQYRRGCVLRVRAVGGAGHLFCWGRVSDKFQCAEPVFIGTVRSKQVDGLLISEIKRLECRVHYGTVTFKIGFFDENWVNHREFTQFYKE
jgi:hypothetical protein